MTFALILSGGRGTRVGTAVPKQYTEVCGKPVIRYTTDAFSASECIDGFFIAADKIWHDYILSDVNKRRFIGFTAPGETRQMSVYNGLRAMRDTVKDSDTVIIHDAARPLVSVELINACSVLGEGYDGVMPVLPMKDTVYLSDDGNTVSSLLCRDKLFAGQSPEAFVFGKYLKANESLIPDRILQINGSTEPAVLAGMKIRLIEGDERNFKITTKNDLMKFDELMRGKQ